MAGGNKGGSPKVMKRKLQQQMKAAKIAQEKRVRRPRE
jgi:hypothetical protein